jgi:hypothetical protein
LPRKELTMNLTREQLETVQKGEPLRFADSGAEFVVLRADLYERLRSLLGEYDASPWTDEEMEALAWEAGQAADWDEMEESDNYCENRGIMPLLE